MVNLRRTPDGTAYVRAQVSPEAQAAIESFIRDHQAALNARLAATGLTADLIEMPRFHRVFLESPEQ